MDIFKEEISKELNRINDKLNNAETISEDDLKIILLSGLFEEDLHESKQ